MFLSIVIGFSLGMVGLIALALMVWLSNTVIGVDAQAKHGISMIDSSRLGGLAIVLFLVTMILIQPLGLITPFAGATFALSNLPSFVLPVVIFGALGLGDDLGIVLKPIIRLTVMSVVALSVFLVHPDLMPWRLLSSSIREIQGISQLFAIFSSLVLVGYINAGNMTDGANGLFFWYLSLIFRYILGTYWRTTLSLYNSSFSQLFHSEYTDRQDHSGRLRSL